MQVGKRTTAIRRQPPNQLLQILGGVGALSQALHQQFEIQRLTSPNQRTSPRCIETSNTRKMRKFAAEHVIWGGSSRGAPPGCRGNASSACVVNPCRVTSSSRMRFAAVDVVSSRTHRLPPVRSSCRWGTCSLQVREIVVVRRGREAGRKRHGGGEIVKPAASVRDRQTILPRRSSCRYAAVRSFGDHPAAVSSAAGKGQAQKN